MIVDHSRVRTRIGGIFPRVQPIMHQYAWNNGQWEVPPNVNERLFSYETQDIWYSKAETTADEVHKGPPWTSGGPFTSIKLGSAYRNDGVIQGYGRYGDDKLSNQFFTGLGYRPVLYVGGFMPLWPSDSQLPVSYRNMWNTDLLLKLTGNSLVPSLTSWGPTAWAKTVPKIEMASGFVFLSESRDLPRMLKRSAKEFHLAWDGVLAAGGSGVNSGAFRKARRDRLWYQTPKEASESFLNQQFGWSPFVSDIRKFYNAYENTAAYMSRMSHGNDKWKTYRRTLLDVNSRTKLLSGTNWSVYPGTQAMQSQMCSPLNSTPWEIWEEKSTLITSVGRFKWNKSEFDMTDMQSYNSAWNTIGRQLTMYGLRVSPSNIWRATPWTWLLDWGLHIGQNIDRMQEQLLDGVVSKYLYLMHHDIKRLVYKITIPFKTGNVSLEYYRLIDIKQRKEAGSPYGFDLSWDSFSPMRLAILAALGITRTSPR